MGLSDMKTMLFVLVVAALIPGCNKPASRARDTLRIGIYPTQDFLPYFVMRELGFDTQNGLNFTETRYDSGAAVIGAMAAGFLDVGYVGTVPLLAAADRAIGPHKVIGIAANNTSDPKHPAGGVLVSISVKGWEELEGEYIAVNALTSIMAAALKGRLMREGVKRYRPVEIAFPNMGLSVVGGNVAGAAMYDPFLTQSLLRGDGKLLDWIIGGPPLERMVTTVTICRSALREGNPAAVRAFLRAHLKSVKWINQNPAASRAILAKHLNLSKEVGQKMRLLRWPEDQRYDSVLLEATQKTLLGIGALKTWIPVDGLFDQALLNEVLREEP